MTHNVSDSEAVSSSQITEEWRAFWQRTNQSPRKSAGSGITDCETMAESPGGRP